MIGADTNLLVRFVTRDDPAQARRARRAILDAASAGERIYVSVIVLCELACVLESGYSQSRQRIAEVLSALLETPEMVVEDADLVRRALDELAAGRADFADALIGHRNLKAGCGATLTFDARLRGCKAFRVL